MEDLRNAFAFKLVPGNDAFLAASETIERFCSDPSGIFPLVTLLETEKEKSIRTLIAITVQKMCRMHAKFYIQSEYFSNLKEKLFGTILFEKNPNITDYLLNSVVELFVAAQANWSELINFIDGLLQNNTNLDISLFLDIFQKLLPHISTEFTQQLFGLFVAKNIENFSKISEPNVIALMKFLNELIRHLSISEDVFSQIFDNIVIYINERARYEHCDNFGALNENLKDLISTFGPYLNSEIISQFVLEIIEDETVSLSNKLLLLPVMEPVIVADDSSSKITYSQILQIILQNDSQELEENFPQGVIDAMITKCTQIEFYQLLSEVHHEIIASDEGQGVGSTLVLLKNVVETIPNAIRLNFAEIFGFIKENIDPNGENVQISINLLDTLCNYGFSEIELFSAEIVDLFSSLLKIDDNNILSLSINALDSFLMQVSVNPEQFQLICNILLTILQEHKHECTYLATDCLVYLINSAQDAVRPQFNLLFAILIKFAASEHVQHEILESCIKAIGSLIKSAPQESEQIIDQFLTFIFETLDSNKDSISDYYEPCIYSLAKICSFKLVSFDLIIQRVFHAVKNDEDEALHPSLILIDQYLKYCTIEQFVDYFNDVKGLICEYLNTEVDKTILRVISRILARISKIFNEINQELYEKLAVFSDMDDFVGIFIYFYRKLIEYDFQLNETLIPTFITTELRLVTTNFDNEDIKTEAFRSLSEFAKKYTNYFPFNEFFQIIGEYNKLPDETDSLLDCVGIYADIFQPSLKPEIIHNMLELFFATLQYINFENVPHMLIGIEKYIENGFILDQDKINQLFECAKTILSSTYSGEFQYFLTIYGVILVLFSAFANIDLPSDIAAEYLPILFQQTNICNFNTNSNQLFLNAIKVCYKYTEIVSNFSSRVITFFLAPLTCNLKKFKNMDLNHETIQSIAAYIDNCVKFDANCQSFVLQQLEDIVLRQRFTDRSGLSYF